MLEKFLLVTYAVAALAGAFFVGARWWLRRVAEDERRRREFLEEAAKKVVQELARGLGRQGRSLVDYLLKETEEKTDRGGETR